MSRPRDPGSDDAGRGLPPLPAEFDPRRKHRSTRKRRDRSSAGRDQVAPYSPSDPPSYRASSSPASGGRATALAGGRRRSGRGILATKIIAVVVSVSAFSYIGYLWSAVHNIDSGVSRIQIAALGGKQADGVARKDIDGKDQNLLIVGNDNRADLTPAEQKLLQTGDDVSLSTDTMMVVHLPADGSKATLISLPRDSYVAIPGYGMNKLNSAYSDGYRSSNGTALAKQAAGATLLVTTIQNLTGLNIDDYVQVGLIGFYRIANAIGGVPVDMCHAVDDTYAHNKAEGSDGGSGLVLKAGVTSITGVQALEFVRQRHGLANGDIDRTARQRYFLTAAFRKVASAGVLLSPSKLGSLVTAVDKSLYVGNDLNLLSVAEQISNLSANNIVGKSIPLERDWKTSPAGDVEVVDPARVKLFVTNLINSGTAAYVKAKTVSPSTVAVTVDNAGGVNGAATVATNTLLSAGFTATVGASVAALDDTTIYYPTGMEAQAKTLAQYVPGANVEHANVSGVTLHLGKDHKTAQAEPASKSKKKSSNAIDAGCIN